jgi:hypothetical protein
MKILSKNNAEVAIIPPQKLILSTDLEVKLPNEATALQAVNELDSKGDVELSKIGIFKLLQILIDGKWLPSHVPTVEAAFTIRQMGMELNIPTMQAFHNIIPIQGKLTLTATLKSALIRRGGVVYTVIRDAEYMYNENGEIVFTKFPKYRGGSQDWVDKYMGRVTTVKGFRYIMGEKIEQEVSFSTIDATAMELMEKDNYKRMLPQMLAARCVSKLSTMFAADLILGLPTTEEVIEDTKHLDYSYQEGKLNVLSIS